MREISDVGVIFTLSAQVTEDSYKIFQHILVCTRETTLDEILKWRDKFGKGCTPISLAITELEQPQKPGAGQA